MNLAIVPVLYVLVVNLTERKRRLPPTSKLPPPPLSEPPPLPEPPPTAIA
jgi:hypothetical protein